VRAFGTGPMSVQDGGGVTSNPTSLTQIANLLYIDPRQSGFSYDVLSTRAPAPSDCSADIFNEYVDAGDMLFAVMSFLDQNPNLKGPIVWMGESYAGVRITWMLAFVRDRWSLAPYEDPTLQSRLATFARRNDLVTKQILLEPWLLGKAHANAIAQECDDPALLSAVAANVSNGCADASACDCASAADHSLYDFAWTNETQNRRLLEADEALVDPSAAEKLLGVPLSSIVGLDARDRQNGFKCATSDASTPNQDTISKELGDLPAGQFYFLPFSPLTPGKGDPNDLPDWENTNAVGAAFVDNLRDVPTFITDGQLDLVVPERALVPGLQSILGSTNATETEDGVTVATSSGSRTIAISHYANAGHMITLLAPSALSTDIRAWLSLTSSP
jgi:hypothetical protein